MAGIVLFSDPHFSNRNAFGSFKTDTEFAGCNNRFHEIAYAFRRALNYANNNDCEAIVIPGDVFHERGVISVPVFNAVRQLFKEAKGDDIRVVASFGNHDMVSLKDAGLTSELHSLFGYEDLIELVNEPKVVKFDSCNIALFPYIHDPKKLVEQSKLLYGQIPSNEYTVAIYHASFTGAESGPHEYKMPHELTSNDLPPFNEIFSGHYHKHQIVRGFKQKVIYIGSPVQHDFGERTYTPGFIHFDNYTWKHFEDTKAPRFVNTEIKDKSELKKLQDKDYKIIRWLGSESAAREIKEDVPNCQVEVVPESVMQNTRTTIDTNDSTELMMRKYVESKYNPFNEPIYEYGLTFVR